MNELKNTKPLIESKQLNFNEKDRTITHYISTETVNRYGYVLKNDGMNATDYNKNPVVLYNHTLSGFCDNPPPKELIIGRNENLSVDNLGVVALTKFADTVLGNDIMQMNKEGLMKSWSVGWNSEAEFIDVNKIPTMLNWDLLEYSSVIIPANPDAVNQMLSFTKANSLRKILSLDFAILNYKNEFDNELSGLKEKIKSLVKDESPEDNKLNKDSKNELKSLINIHKKETNDLFLKVLNKINNLESNLYKNILNKMPNIVETAIRKYTGKLD